MSEKEQEDGSFFSKLEICSVIKPKCSIILQVLEIANKYILILPNKGDIEIYETKLYKFLMILPNSIHTDRINRVTELKSGLLVTTSSDQTSIILKLDYDKKDYEEIQILIGHTSDVWMCLELSDGNLATCSNDHTIRIWFNNPETKQYEKFKILNTDDDDVGEMLETKNKILVTCSVFDASYEVQLWDISKYERIGIVEDIATWGYKDLIQLTDDIVCVNGSRDEEGLQFISLSKMAKVNHIQDFNDNKIESFYTAKDGTIFIGYGEGSDEDINDPSYVGHIKQYKFNEKDITLTEIYEKRKAHNFYVLGFNQLSNGDFVSYANDVKIWK
jgi:WD40 repeat protein